MNVNEPPDIDLEIPIEPERYELHAGPVYQFDMDRREFFKTLGCGVVVLYLVDAAFAQESGRPGRGGGGRGRPAEISAWLHLGEDGTVTAFTGKVEVGQNIRTSLSQAVAEELRLPVSSVRMVMADTALTPFDGGTTGSRSTPDMGAQLHKVAAAAREALLDLAAEQFKAERGSLKIADGTVTNPASGESVTFSQLTKGQQLLKAADNKSATTPAAEWKIAGTSIPKVNGRELVTGKHKYSSDVSLPGMLHGKIVRPPAFEAELASIDIQAAAAMAGVTVVQDKNFIGVTAPDPLTASTAASAIQAEWSTHPQPSNAELFGYLKGNPASGGRGGGGGGRGGSSGNSGSVDEAFASADHKIERTYNIAYIAHTPLEPRAAVADWKDDKLTVWTGTQRPFGVRSELAQALGLKEEQVHVITPDTGSGYGGKHTGEAAVEAARLSKSAGKPVKLVWTRQEEFTWAYLRPAGVIDIRAGVSNDGKITYWEMHNYNSGGSALGTPYDISSKKTEFHSTKTPLRQGSYRGLASTANNFAREVHMDDLARAVKMDPLEFRLKNLKDSRLKAVLEAAAEAFQWGKQKPEPGHGFGIAGGFEKGSYLATCAEVRTDTKTGEIKVLRAVSAFECGAVVNPDHLKNQIEGAMVMGIGGALFEAIEFENGKITNARLSEYRVPRFSDTPVIETVLVNRKDLASIGAGETPIIGIAPAISNAICHATGIRLHSLPMAPNGLKV